VGGAYTDGGCMGGAYTDRAYTDGACVGGVVVVARVGRLGRGLSFKTCGPIMFS
jgi:hypothetical protein